MKGILLAIGFGIGLVIGGIARVNENLETIINIAKSAQIVKIIKGE